MKMSRASLAGLFERKPRVVIEAFNDGGHPGYGYAVVSVDGHETAHVSLAQGYIPTVQSMKLTHVDQHIIPHSRYVSRKDILKIQTTFGGQVTVKNE